MKRAIAGVAGWVLLAGLAGCSKEPAPPVTQDRDPAVGLNLTAATPAPAETPNSQDPTLFAPLRSVEVKDAIYRALKSGKPERWQDGALSGYAVPSLTPGPNGCRAVRYSVDQRAAGNFETITACDASR